MQQRKMSVLSRKQATQNLVSVGRRQSRWQACPQRKRRERARRESGWLQVRQARAGWVAVSWFWKSWSWVRWRVCWTRLAARQMMLRRWAWLLMMLMKALVILPPMFRSAYLFCSRSTVCSSAQLAAMFSMISPFMQKKISISSSGKSSRRYLLYSAIDESSSDSQFSSALFLRQAAMAWSRISLILMQGAKSSSSQRLRSERMRSMRRAAIRIESLMDPMRSQRYSRPSMTSNSSQISMQREMLKRLLLSRKMSTSWSLFSLRAAISRTKVRKPCSDSRAFICASSPSRITFSRYSSCSSWSSSSAAISSSWISGTQFCTRVMVLRGSSLRSCLMAAWMQLASWFFSLLLRSSTSRLNSFSRNSKTSPLAEPLARRQISMQLLQLRCRKLISACRSGRLKRRDSSQRLASLPSMKAGNWQQTSVRILLMYLAARISVRSSSECPASSSSFSASIFSSRPKPTSLQSGQWRMRSTRMSQYLAGVNLTVLQMMMLLRQRLRRCSISPRSALRRQQEMVDSSCSTLRLPSRGWIHSSSCSPRRREEALTIWEFSMVKQQERVLRQSVGRSSSSPSRIFSERKCCERMVIILAYWSRVYSLRIQLRCRQSFTYQRARKAQATAKSGSPLSWWLCEAPQNLTKGVTNSLSLPWVQMCARLTTRLFCRRHWMTMLRSMRARSKQMASRSTMSSWSLRTQYCSTASSWFSGMNFTRPCSMNFSSTLKKMLSEYRSAPADCSAASVPTIFSFTTLNRNSNWSVSVRNSSGTTIMRRQSSSLSRLFRISGTSRILPSFLATYSTLSICPYSRSSFSCPATPRSNRLARLCRAVRKIMAHSYFCSTLSRSVMRRQLQQTYTPKPRWVMKQISLLGYSQRKVSAQLTQRCPSRPATARTSSGSLLASASISTCSSRSSFSKTSKLRVWNTTTVLSSVTSSSSFFFICCTKAILRDISKGLLSTHSHRLARWFCSSDFSCSLSATRCSRLSKEQLSTSLSPFRSREGASTLASPQETQLQPALSARRKNTRRQKASESSLEQLRAKMKTALTAATAKSELLRYCGSRCRQLRNMGGISQMLVTGQLSSEASSWLSFTESTEKKLFSMRWANSLLPWFDSRMMLSQPLGTASSFRQVTRLLLKSLIAFSSRSCRLQTSSRRSSKATSRQPGPQAKAEMPLRSSSCSPTSSPLPRCPIMQYLSWCLAMRSTLLPFILRRMLSLMSSGQQFSSSLMPSRRVLLRGKVQGSGDGMLKQGSGTGVSGICSSSMRSSDTFVRFLGLGAIRQQDIYINLQHLPAMTETQAMTAAPAANTHDIRSLLTAGGVRP